MTSEQGTCIPCSGTGLRNAAQLCPTCDGSGGKSQPADRDVTTTASSTASVTIPEPETATAVSEFDAPVEEPAEEPAESVATEGQ